MGPEPSPEQVDGTLPVPHESSRVVLRRLALREFRNLERADLALPPDGLTIVGENGHGKSNLLEAVYYLQLLRSVRGARDADLVRFGAGGFHVAGEVVLPGRGAGAREIVRDVGVGFDRTGKRKRVRIDGSEVGRLTDALGAVPSVIFSPGDVVLVSGSPSERRRYLDVVLALTSRRYLAALQAYRGALLRRNAALRDVARSGGARGEQRVAVWEPALAEHGALLWLERRRWVARHAARFAELCAAIGERAPMRMRYATALAVPELQADALSEHAADAADDQSSAAEAGAAAAADASARGPSAEASHTAGATAGSVDADRLALVRAALERALAEKRLLDLKRGVTHAGPHRDDLDLALGGRDVRVFGSAGQQRTAAIALRMLEAATLRDHVGSAPLFLLDDPFAELDARRARHILGLLGDAGLGQVLLVVPRASDVPPELTRLTRTTIRDGVVGA